MLVLFMAFCSFWQSVAFVLTLVLTCTANTLIKKKIVLFAHVKCMRSTDFFLPILWHEVGISFLGVSELWLHRKKLTLSLEELFLDIKQAATGKRFWPSLCCKGKEVP